MGAGPSIAIHPAPRCQNFLAVDHTSGPLRRAPMLSTHFVGSRDKKSPRLSGGIDQSSDQVRRRQLNAACAHRKSETLKQSGQ